jgi:peptidoglycan/LPS O-acetylase OafA/YrhL
MAALSPKCFLYRARWLVTSVVADLSYSLYLVHKGVIHLSQLGGAHLGIQPAGSLEFVMSVAVCLLVALLMRLLIERPSMKARSRLLTFRDKRGAIPNDDVVIAINAASRDPPGFGIARWRLLQALDAAAVGRPDPNDKTK